MPHRLLIVDDNAPLREMFRETFSGRGFEVIVAATVTEALQAAARHAIDAVLTDLEIPDMSGLELCDALTKQRNASGRSIPVWLMTGSEQPDIALRALAAGACGLLRKPFSPEDACAFMRCVLEGETPRDRPMGDGVPGAAAGECNSLVTNFRGTGGENP
jgi:CheY-like chemotaxis protein